MVHTNNDGSTESYSKKSIVNMPIPRSRLAPEKFRGDYSKVQAFITHYELLCDYNNIETDREKCETIIRYVSSKVRQVILGLNSYASKNWTTLKKDLLLLYDAERDVKRYRVRDIIKFVKKTKNKSIHNLAGWKKYVRNFIMIAGWLLEQNKLTTDAHATYFWNGIPRSLRNRLENRILAQDPIRDLSTPFSFEETKAAAEALFQRDRFDMNMVDTDDDEDDSPHDDPDSSNSESSDSDSDGDNRYDKSYRHRKHRGGHKKRQRRDPESDEEENIRRVNAPRSGTRKESEITQTETVEALIKEMNNLHVGDPKYASVFWKAIKLDADVRMVVPEPQLRAPLAEQSYSSRVPMPQSRAPQYQGQSRPQFQRQSPPHQMNATYQSQQANPGPPLSRPPMDCYGCHESGHGISQCPRIDSLVAQGAVKRDHNNRLTRSDGSYVKRVLGESFVETIEREIAPPGRSNFIAYYDEEMSEDEVEQLMYESDQYDQNEPLTYLAVPEVVQIDPYGYPVNGVERQDKSTTLRRREVMDSVVIPKSKHFNRDVPNRGRREGITTRSQDYPPPPPALPRSIPVASTRPATFIPKAPVLIDKRRVSEQTPAPLPRPAPSRPQKTKENNQSIRDVGQDKKRGDGKQERGNEMKVDAGTKPITSAAPQEALGTISRNDVNPFTQKAPAANSRHSAISAKVRPISILDNLLNTQVQIAFGDLLGSSKELSGLMTDALKTKAAKPIIPTAALLINTFKKPIKPPPTRGTLIKFQMECNGEPLTAIVDTGSELNIVSERASKRKIQLPVDIRHRVKMNDANGGVQTLQGLVDNVPLSCGGLATLAALHVAKKVPFELLLGRPWQQGNYVSIDERRDGTYLMFKDPEDMEDRYEIRVETEEIEDSRIFPFNASRYVDADNSDTSDSEDDDQQCPTDEIRCYSATTTDDKPSDHNDKDAIQSPRNDQQQFSEISAEVPAFNESDPVEIVSPEIARSIAQAQLVTACSPILSQVYAIRSDPFKTKAMSREVTDDQPTDNRDKESIRQRRNDQRPFIKASAEEPATEESDPADELSPEIARTNVRLQPVASSSSILSLVFNTGNIPLKVKSALTKFDETIKSRIQEQKVAPIFQPIQTRIKQLFTNVLNMSQQIATPTQANQQLNAPDSAQDSVAIIPAVQSRRTLPEFLLLAQGDVGHLRRNNQLSEFILSSRDTLRLAPVDDDLGFRKQTFWAIGCAAFVDPPQPDVDRAIKYGSAEINFYEGLGRGAPPPDWTFPSMPAPAADGVSSNRLFMNRVFPNLFKLKPAAFLPIEVNGSRVGYAGRQLTHSSDRFIAGNPSPFITYPSTSTSSAPPIPSIVLVPPPVFTPSPDDLSKPISLPTPCLDHIRDVILRQRDASCHDCGQSAHPLTDCKVLPPPTSDHPPPGLTRNTNHVYTPYTAINSAGTVAPSIVGNPSCISSNIDNNASTDSLPDLVYDDESEASGDDMDWEQEMEDAEIDELNPDHYEMSAITRDDVESARLLIALRESRPRIVTPTMPQTPTPSPTPVPSLITQQQQQLMDNLVKLIGPRRTTAPTLDSDAIPDTPTPYLTRSHTRLAKRRRLDEFGPAQTPSALFDRLNLTSATSTPILRPGPRDITVFSARATEYDRTLIPARVLSIIDSGPAYGVPRLPRATTTDDDQHRSSMRTDSRTSMVPDSEPGRQRSESTIPAPLSRTRTIYVPASPIVVSSSSPSPPQYSSAITRPNTPDPELDYPSRMNESMTRSPTPDYHDDTQRKRSRRDSESAPVSPRTRLERTRNRRVRPSDRTLRSQTRATDTQRSQDDPIEEMGTQTYHSIPSSAPDAILDHDAPVIHREPVLTAYPSITQNLHAQSNLERDVNGQGMPVTVPSSPSANTFSQTPPPLPLSQSFRFRTDQPRTEGDERRIPIRERRYRGWGDIESSRPVARVKGFLKVDIRTLQVLTSTADIPPYFVKRFTILGGVLDPYVLPHSIDNTPNGACDIPPYSATTWSSRVDEFHDLRRATNCIISDTIKCLTVDQNNECNCSTISIFRLHHGRLVPTATDRTSFFERLHPSFNPFVTVSEGIFLRSAVYILRETPSYIALADSIDILLRTAHYDTWLIRELIAMDRLGLSRRRDDDTFRFIENVENERLSDQYHDEDLARAESARRAQHDIQSARSSGYSRRATAGRESSDGEESH